MLAWMAIYCPGITTGLKEMDEQFIGGGGTKHAAGAEYFQESCDHRTDQHFSSHQVFRVNRRCSADKLSVTYYPDGQVRILYREISE